MSKRVVVLEEGAVRAVTLLPAGYNSYEQDLEVALQTQSHHNPSINKMGNLHLQYQEGGVDTFLNTLKELYSVGGCVNLYQPGAYSGLGTPTFWDGVLFPSQAEAGRETGFYRAQLTRHAEKGRYWSHLTNDFTNEGRDSFVWEGETCRNIQYCANKYGYSLPKMRRYVADGLTGKADVVRANYTNTVVVFDYELYPSWNAFVRSQNIDPREHRAVREQGWLQRERVKMPVVTNAGSWGFLDTETIEYEYAAAKLLLNWSIISPLVTQDAKTVMKSYHPHQFDKFLSTSLRGWV